jgi:hypothetical protein
VERGEREEGREGGRVRCCVLTGKNDIEEQPYPPNKKRNTSNM